MGGNVECVQLQLAQSKGGQGSCPPPLRAGALGGDFGPHGEQNEDQGKRNTSNNY